MDPNSRLNKLTTKLLSRLFIPEIFNNSKSTINGVAIEILNTNANAIKNKQTTSILNFLKTS